MAIRRVTESLHMITSHCLAQAQAHQHGQNQLHGILLKHGGNIKYDISKCFIAKRNVLKVVMCLTSGSILKITKGIVVHPEATARWLG